MRTSSSLHWKVAGQAGEGIDVTGVMFGKVCMRQGMNVFSYREYPSLIRGGHNTHQVHASFEPLTAQQKHIDVLIAFNEEGISLHQAEIDKDSVVFCEATQDGYDLEKYRATGAMLYDFPMSQISREVTGHFLSQNMVALGGSVWVLGLNLDILKQVVTDQFKSKGEELVTQNIAALQKGYDYAKEHCPPLYEPMPQYTKSQILVTANYAVALGAVSAGLQYFSAYPMTPTSDVLHSLASAQTHFPLVVKHVEDEIAAINQAIGASYMGVRAMTASATGGYALMVEGTALAAIMEVPLVICVGQRPGPATGLPTWTCQSDLQFILRAGHGEFPRVVLTPSTMQEHFDLTRLAFELAEKHHLVVFILSDKFALESYGTMTKPDQVYKNPRYGFAESPLPSDDSYRRFAPTQTGTSPRSIPGQSHGLGVTNSYEHDEFGYATEDAAMTKLMNDRRQQKMASLANEVPAPILIGPPVADVTLIGWGSTRLVLEEVMRQANRSTGSFSVNSIHIPCAWPFPVDAFQKLTSTAKRLIMVEGNATGQMEQLIRQETCITIPHHIRRYDGRPFYPDEVLAEVAQIVQTK